MRTTTRTRGAFALVAALVAWTAGLAYAGDSQPFTARAGEELARSAAFA